MNATTIRKGWRQWGREKHGESRITTAIENNIILSVLLPFPSSSSWGSNRANWNMSASAVSFTLSLASQSYMWIYRTTYSITVKIWYYTCISRSSYSCTGIARSLHSCTVIAQALHGHHGSARSQHGMHAHHTAHTHITRHLGLKFYILILFSTFHPSVDSKDAFSECFVQLYLTFEVNRWYRDSCNTFIRTSLQRSPITDPIGVKLVLLSDKTNTVSKTAVFH